MELDGVIALITGGASGLGAAAAKELVAAGARVVIADKNDDLGARYAELLGPTASFVETDVTDADSVARAVHCAEEQGDLRVGVHTAGFGIPGLTVEANGAPHDPDSFRQVVEVNVFGTFHVLRLVAASIVKLSPYNEDGARGVVITTASIAAFEGQSIAYAASKGGVASMTLPAARDLAVYGVRVCCIAPGAFDTPLMAASPEEAKRSFAADIPFPRRFGDPPAFGALARHIAENDYLNGETIRLDAALRLPPR